MGGGKGGQLKKSMRAIGGVALALALMICLEGCGPKIYINPDFQTIREDHHTVAILPFKVNYDAGKLPKDIDEATLAQMQQDEAMAFQQELYSRFLERQAKGEYTIEFQDVTQTNALLSKYGTDYANIDHYTMTELQNMLGADAMISGTIRRSRPMSTGAAIATAILFGVAGETNRVDVNVNLHDGPSGKLLWKYDHHESGSLGSSSEGLAKSLMKGISKKFPYKRAK